MNSLVRMKEAHAVSLMSLHLCLQSFAGVTSREKKKQLLIRAEEIIVDIECAIKIFCHEAILDIENQSDVASALLATVHEGVTIAQLELFSKRELRELKRRRQKLTGGLFAHLSKIEMTLVEKVQTQERSFHVQMSLAKAHIDTLKDTLNP